MNRVNMNWKQTYDAHPLKERSYTDFTLVEKVKLLDSLCYWRLQDSTDIQNFLWQHGEDAENKAAAVDSEEEEEDEEFGSMVQPKPLGLDDAGRVYWYFEDECWVYREEWPKPPTFENTYKVEYACPEYVRLHIDAREIIEPDESSVATITATVSNVINQIVMDVAEMDESEEAP